MAARSRFLERLWYENHPLSLLLSPFGWCYGALAWLRRVLYRLNVLRVVRTGVPVIVVGNISVGGTGKTPLVIWLAGFLAAQGYRPAIISRGYKGQAKSWPQQVRAGSDPTRVGDEPVLMARRTNCPVAVDPNRLRGVRALMDANDCNVIISDDGLQHYRLGRDIEIALIDDVRRHGNGRCLPAGPLREFVSRLGRVDMIVANGHGQRGEYSMQLKPGPAVKVGDMNTRSPLKDLQVEAVHAVCGIGYPGRFFDMLRRLGFHVIEHPFADHHVFSAADINFDDGHRVIMTEKDAVKCLPFAGENHWYVPVTAELNEAFSTRLLALLDNLRPRT